MQHHSVKTNALAATSQLIERILAMLFDFAHELTRKTTLVSIAKEIRKAYLLFTALLVSAFAGYFIGENGILALLMMILAAGFSWAIGRETDRRIENEIKKLRSAQLKSRRVFLL
jgi:cadmium resistance protein CadD (predicted permease)